MRRDQGETDSELCKGKEAKKNEKCISKYFLLSLLNNKIDNKIVRKIKPNPKIYKSLKRIKKERDDQNHKKKKGKRKREKCRYGNKEIVREERRIIMKVVDSRCGKGNSKRSQGSRKKSSCLVAWPLKKTFFKALKKIPQKIP